LGLKFFLSSPFNICFFLELTFMIFSIFPSIRL
jgi:hypothetical protein